MKVGEDLISKSLDTRPQTLRWSWSGGLPASQPVLYRKQAGAGLGQAQAKFESGKA